MSPRKKDDFLYVGLLIFENYLDLILNGNHVIKKVTSKKVTSEKDSPYL